MTVSTKKRLQYMLRTALCAGICRATHGGGGAGCRPPVAPLSGGRKTVARKSTARSGNALRRDSGSPWSSLYSSAAQRRECARAQGHGHRGGWAAAAGAGGSCNPEGARAIGTPFLHHNWPNACWEAADIDVWGGGSTCETGAAGASSRVRAAIRIPPSPRRNSVMRSMASRATQRSPHTQPREERAGRSLIACISALTHLDHLQMLASCMSNPAL